MSIKEKLLEFFSKTLIKMFFLNKQNIFSAYFAQNLNPVYKTCYKGEKFCFSFCNALTRWRLETYFTKEPETIEWIDTFKKDEQLFDIGANIGLYTIYAAKRGVKVIAFEPESQNFAELNKNAYLNHCQDKVACLNIALSDKDCQGYLNIPFFQAGGAINSLGKEVDENGKDFIPVFKQGVISFSLDSFLANYDVPFPNHIKIDVDGIEPDIIKGAFRTLEDKRLKSLLIEINEDLPEHMEIIDILQKKGYFLYQKAHSEIFNSGKYCKTFNYIFIRY